MSAKPAPFDEAATKSAASEPPACSCPSALSKSFAHRYEERQGAGAPPPSRLMQWPVQIKLAPVNAPYFEDADLLIAADCSAYAYGDFHNRFIRNHITLIGCPKLDSGDYTEKLSAIILNNRLRSITVVRMEVPCCGGLERAAADALKMSSKPIPLRVFTITTGGIIVK